MSNSLSYKCILLGDAGLLLFSSLPSALFSLGVGKSQLKERILHDAFNMWDKSSIIPVYHFQEFNVSGKSIILQIWDTVSKEKLELFSDNFSQGKSVT